MVLTRSFKETIQARMERDPTFREELLKEGVECLLSGDMDTGKAYCAASNGTQPIMDLQVDRLRNTNGVCSRYRFAAWCCGAVQQPITSPRQSSAIAQQAQFAWFSFKKRPRWTRDLHAGSGKAEASGCFCLVGPAMSVSSNASA